MEAILTKTKWFVVYTPWWSINNQLVYVNGKLAHQGPRITEPENRIKAIKGEFSKFKGSSQTGAAVESIVSEINDRERRTRNVIMYSYILSESKSNTWGIERLFLPWSHAR